MAKYLYPAVFKPEEVGYTVLVPDITNAGIGCVTCGDTFEEACAMAFEAIGLCIETFIDEGIKPPVASKPSDLDEVEADDYIVPIEVDMEKFAEKYPNENTIRDDP